LANVSPEARYRTLIDAVRDYAIFLLDADGIVATWNAGAERIKGYRADEVIGRHFSMFYPETARQRGYPQEELDRAARLGRWEDEGWRVRKDGSRFWANAVITALRDDAGALIGFAKVTRDLTERRNAEERLQHSEAQLRLLMDAVEDAIVMLDDNGYVTSWNAGASKLEGFDASEIIGQHVSRFYPMEDIAARRPEAELAAAATRGRMESEAWRLRKDGSRFWANVVITAVYDENGKLHGYASVTRDMTERDRLRQLEYASELAARTEATREEEKKRIARELHDDLGQQLTALKMDVTSLIDEESVPRDEAALLRHAAVMRDAVDHAIASVRRLAAGLRPAVLDDLGLLPALEWLVDDFGQRSGLRAVVTGDVADVGFNDAAATALFRIVQEGLSNAGRHARGATTVVVELSCSASMCDLVIRDDGAPVAPVESVSVSAPRPSGLAGIRDRVRRLGGTVAAGPEPGRGFAIRLSVPRASIE
jgi:PAS domain S-box-containing protein